MQKPFSDQGFLLYNRIASGANRTTTAPQETSAQTISHPVTPPCIRPRAAVTTRLTGLTLTIARSHPGMVGGETKMLLASMSGKMITELVWITDSPEPRM